MNIRDDFSGMNGISNFTPTICDVYGRACPGVEEL